MVPWLTDLDVAVVVTNGNLLLCWVLADACDNMLAVREAPQLRKRNLGEPSKPKQCM